MSMGAQLQVVGTSVVGAGNQRVGVAVVRMLGEGSKGENLQESPYSKHFNCVDVYECEIWTEL